MLGTNLKDLRKKNQKKLREVALGTGLSIAYICDLERGRTEPSLATLRRLAWFYGVKVSQLLEDE